MPNGGYPINFMAPIGDTGFALIAHGSDVRLVQRFDQAPEKGTELRPKFHSIGDLMPNQIRALLYHLQYWGGGSDGHGSSATNSTFLGEVVEPKFRTAGCIYDY